MNLYKSDFNYISDSDRKLWENLKAQEIVYIDGKPTDFRTSYYHQYPKPVRHFLSIFPNNFVDAIDLTEDKDRLELLVAEFEHLINTPSISERDILNFINKNEAFFIVGSILKTNYRFGHHALFNFPEFKLGTNYQADYLLVGENSHGYHFVFVEFENPYGNITTQSGDYGLAIRKGESQINDWDDWLSKNFSYIKLEFEKSIKNGINLPNEFRDFDKTRIHYVIVAGKRKDFNEKTQRLNRKKLSDSSLLILHYDNLIEMARAIIGMYTY